MRYWTAIQKPEIIGKHLFCVCIVIWALQLFQLPAKVEFIGIVKSTYFVQTVSIRVIVMQDMLFVQTEWALQTTSALDLVILSKKLCTRPQFTLTLQN